MGYETIGRADAPQAIRKSAPAECLDTLRELTNQASNIESEFMNRLSGFLTPDYEGDKVAQTTRGEQVRPSDSYPPYFCEVRATHEELQIILSRMQKIISRIQL